MSGEFDSRKDSHSAKFERRPQIFVKLSESSNIHKAKLKLEYLQRAVIIEI